MQKQRWEKSTNTETAMRKEHTYRNSDDKEHKYRNSGSNTAWWTGIHTHTPYCILGKQTGAKWRYLNRVTTMHWGQCHALVVLSNVFLIPQVQYQDLVTSSKRVVGKISVQWQLSLHYLQHFVRKHRFTDQQKQWTHGISEDIHTMPMLLLDNKGAVKITLNS